MIKGNIINLSFLVGIWGGVVDIWVGVTGIRGDMFFITFFLLAPYGASLPTQIYPIKFQSNPSTYDMKSDEGSN